MSDFVNLPIDKLMNTGHVANAIDDLETKTAEGLTVTADTLDEISSDLGVQVSGKFIAPIGENITPNDAGFSGAFISGEGEEFADGTIKFGAVTNGVLNFGVADDGSVIANSVQFNGTEIDARVILDDFGYMTRQTGTQGSEIRTMRIGMTNNGTSGEGVIEFYEPSSDVVIPNYGFEDGDLSDWTTGGTSVTWTADTLNKHSGGYAAKCVFASTGSNPTIENEARFEVSSGSICNFSLYTYLAPAAHVTLTLTMQVKFYDALTGGSLVSTETIGTRTSGVFGTPSPWSEMVKKLTVPATATHAVFYVAGDIDDNLSSSFSLDDFTVTPVGGSQLTFEDLDITYTPVGNSAVSLVPIKYANCAAPAISTSGETTVFSVTIPANKLLTTQISSEFYFVIATSTSSRTLTIRRKVGATTSTETLTLAAGKIYRGYVKGILFRSGTDVQNVYYNNKIYNDSDGSILNQVISAFGAYEDDAATIVFTVTLQLSGAVNSGHFFGVVVRDVENVDIW